MDPCNGLYITEILNRSAFSLKQAADFQLDIWWIGWWTFIFLYTRSRIAEWNNTHKNRIQRALTYTFDSCVIKWIMNGNKTLTIQILYIKIIFHCVQEPGNIREINSFPHSAAYMRQWIGSALVQIMACRLFGAEPLSKHSLGYCQLDPQEQTSVAF